MGHAAAADLVVALEGLGLLEQLTDAPGDAERLTAVRLALADGQATVRDGAEVGHLIDPEFLRTRAREAPHTITEPAGGVVDNDGMAVSFIQSLYEPFGSGVVAGDTGVVLQNRGACFSVGGRVVPGARPYHTIIPGMLERDGALLDPFGCMGGFIQAQAHVQVISALVDDHRRRHRPAPDARARERRDDPPPADPLRAARTRARTTGEAQTQNNGRGTDRWAEEGGA